MKTVSPLERGLQVGFGHSSEPDVIVDWEPTPALPATPPREGIFRGATTPRATGLRRWLDLAPICQTLKRSVLDTGSGTLPHLPR